MAATMDPNNPVLNPDMSRLGATRNLPPGARVPAPVLPQDTIQTQFASKPPTEEHASEGDESVQGTGRADLPACRIAADCRAVTQEEQKLPTANAVNAPSAVAQGPSPRKQPSAQPYDPRYTGQR